MLWERLVLMGTAAIGSVSGAMAQNGTYTDKPFERVIVHGAPSCVVETSGGEHTLSVECLNARLRDSHGTGEQSLAELKAVDAVGRGNPETVGTFSYTATAVRMGANFGHSVKPERPAAPGYAHPIAPGGKP